VPEIQSAASNVIAHTPVGVALPMHPESDPTPHQRQIAYPRPK
jgi:hypothetical protein